MPLCKLTAIGPLNVANSCPHPQRLSKENVWLMFDDLKQWFPNFVETLPKSR